MRYLLLVATDPEADPAVRADAERDDGVDTIEEWVAKHDASGQRVLGDRLRPASDAATVRRRGGRLLVTDGPVAESHEWIVGIDVLECADLDEAIAIASRHPMAAAGQIEVRPFWPFEEPDGMEGPVEAGSLGTPE